MVRLGKIDIASAFRLLECGVIAQAGWLLWPLVLLGLWQASELAWWLAGVLVRGLGPA